MLHDDPVHLVGQEDEVDKRDSGFKMPFGVRDDRVAPLLTGVHVDAVLEARVAVVEGGQGGSDVVNKRQEDCSDLKRFVNFNL